MGEEIYNVMMTMLNDKPEERIYTITLEDGTQIGDLRLNGNNFISKTEISPEIFDGNLSTVTINGGERDEIHQNMKLANIMKIDDEYWFVLRELSPFELENARLRADIAFLAMMTNIDI